MHTVTQVPKPSLHRRSIQLLDARVLLVKTRASLARDADPVRRLVINEAQIHGIRVLDVFEFLGVDVCEEEKVGAVSLGDSHDSGDGTDACTLGDHQAEFEAVGYREEIFGLLLLRGVAVDLLLDAGVRVGTGAGERDFIGHSGVVLSEVREFLA